MIMADITMCTGENCPVKNKCYRHTASPNVRQAYFLFPPFREGKCEMFWGEQSEFIFNQLKSITNGKSNS